MPTEYAGSRETAAAVTGDDNVFSSSVACGVRTYTIVLRIIAAHEYSDEEIVSAVCEQSPRSFYIDCTGRHVLLNTELDMYEASL